MQFSIIHAVASVALLTGVSAQYSSMEVNNGVTTIDGTKVPTNCPGLGTKTALSSGSAQVYCCVEKDPYTRTASMCSGFPFCSDTTSGQPAMTINSASCETYIPVTAKNFDDLVGSATKSIAVVATGGTPAPQASSSAAQASATSASGNSAVRISHSVGGPIALGLGLSTFCIAFMF